MERNEVQSNIENNVPISTTTIIDNSPVLTSKYPILESSYVVTCNLKNNHVHLIKINNMMKELTCVLEDNEIEMNIKCWGGRVNKKLIKIPSSGHLRYDWFKQNFKSDNFIQSMLKSLSNNVDGNMSSSLINVCHYMAECYEDEFVPAAED